MITVDDLTLAPIDDRQVIGAVEFPAGPKFRQFLITGPPGVGKSTLITKMRGWPYEGYIDLSSSNWWRGQDLTLRPREVHMGAPFVDHQGALTVLDDEWLEPIDPLEMDYSRISMPPGKSWVLGKDWKSKYVFEFLLPSVDLVCRDRLERARSGLFPYDRMVSRDIVTRQIDFYRTIAWYFWVSGLRTYIRTERDGVPKRIVECRRSVSDVFSSIGAASFDTTPRAKPKPRTPLFGGLIEVLTERQSGTLVTPGIDPIIVEEPVRVAWNNGPFALRLGNTCLSFHPDLSIEGEANGAIRDWIVHAGDSFFDAVPTFVRVDAGQHLILGRFSEIQTAVLRFDESVANRHLEISNAKGNLTIRVLDPDLSCDVTSLEADEHNKSVWQSRRETLSRLADVVGRELVPFSTEEAVVAVADVNRILDQEVYRDPDDEGRPGGVIRFPDDMTVVILGDTHTQMNNVLRLISEGGLLTALELGRACLVFLGDLVHNEEDGQREEMESSLFALDMFMMLKRRFPENVFYTRGNHESFSPEIGKGGIPQGLLLRKHLKARRGDGFVDAVETLFSNLAFVVQGRNFAAVHGAPVRTTVTRQTLVNVQHFRGIQAELVWNRLRQSNRPTGYGKGSVKRFRKTLGLPDQAAIIVGHTPLSRTETLWMDVGGIPNHHVVFSALPHRFAAMVIRDGVATPMEFVPESSLAFLND